jgi:acetoin utilization deacetylase AcuC-like enzyme
VPIPVVHHPDYVAPLPVQADGRPHRFPMDKFALVMTALRDSGAALACHAPEPTPRPALEVVHTAKYVASILGGTLTPEQTRRIGFPVTPAVVRRALLASGGTWLAAKLALDHGYAANTAGGSHHAHPDFGAGFCVFNDIAVAAARLLEAGEVRRILVIDLDVHQGDGTARIFADDARIYTFSMHCDANFPVRKAVSSRDVGLARGIGDDAYLELLDRHLPEVLAAARPDFVFYLAGVDPHTDDGLGHLALTDAGLAARDQHVAARARAAGLPMASVLGGGYGGDVAAVANRHARTILTLGTCFGQS